jgi:hypothetical protein
MHEAEVRTRELLEQMPEIGLLRDVARATGESIRIRGGVPRNLLAHVMGRAPARASAPRHLVDLVDPLSDVDVVVSRSERIPLMFGLIFSRLALAGFMRWEGKTAAQVSHFEKSGPMSSLDGVEIEVTKSAARLRRADPAIEDLKRGRLRSRPAKRWLRKPSDNEDAEAILFALRLARFAVEFGVEVDEEPVLRPRRTEGRLSPADMLRVEFAALDVPLTAPAQEDIGRGLLRVLEIVPTWVRHRSRILIQLEDISLDRPLRIIAWPRRGVRPPRVRLETDVQQNAALADEPTLLPWTAIRLPPFGEAGCCRPDDFMLGPLVIAWRGQTLAQQHVGVVALAPNTDPYDDTSRTVFPVPGVVTSGPAIVQRFDWGFARYLAGDGRLVYFGVREAILPEPGEADLVTTAMTSQGSPSESRGYA